MARAADYLSLLRPENDFLMGAIVVVGALVGGGGRLPGCPALAIGFLVAFALSASAMVLNDVVDLEIDRLNQPDRPLPSGRVPVGHAWALFGALSAVGLALSALQGEAELALALASYVVAVSYDLRGKRTGLPGNAMVAFTGVSPILYGSLLSGGISLVVALEALMIFLAMMGREIVKGVADVEGDVAHGVRTLAVAIGRGPASLVSVAFFGAAVALSPLPPLLGLANRLLYSVPVAIADAAFIYASTSVAREPTRERALRAKELELATYAIALLGFALGSLRWA
ncbi:MAG: geranylgeranylglycerol-phosphate geranylgeranyltransferase [Acidilobus sp.]